MGRKYKEILSGDIWICSHCETHLANDSDILSKDYHASSGPAILFDSAVNFTEGKPKKSHLRSGVYVIADIFCIDCHLKFGWIYKEAEAEEYKYKVDRMVLENASIKRITTKDV